MVIENIYAVPELSDQYSLVISDSYPRELGSNIPRISFRAQAFFHI